MKTRQIAIGVAISALFLYLAFRKADLGAVGTHLAGANYWYLIPASVLTLIALWIRAYRWGVLLHPLKSISPYTLFSATAIGFMGNNILPMRLGEVIRAYVLGRATGLRASAAFATIVVERLFDLFAMIGIFAVLLVFAPFHNRSFKLSVLVAFLGGAAVLVGLLWLHLRGARLEVVARRFLPARLRPRVAGMLVSFQSGLGIFRDPGRLLAVGALTAIMWLCITVVIEICFSAAHLEQPGSRLPATASLFVLVVMAIGVMVPSGPGFVGTLQAAALFGLLIIGYRDQARALSFSIVYHATQWFPVVLAGLFFLMREHLSLAQIRGISGPADLADAPDAGEGESGGPER